MRYLSVLLVIVAGTSVAWGAQTGGHGGGGGSGDVFAGTFAQSIAAAIVFLILLTVLWKFAWGPILTGLQDREQKIKADLDQAQAAADEARATLEQYQRQLAEAAAEAGRIIEQGKADAHKIAASLKDQTQAEITQIRQRAQADIQSAKQQAISDVYAQAATLATGVAGQILGREVKAADHQRLIDESIAAMSESASG